MPRCRQPVRNGSFLDPTSAQARFVPLEIALQARAEPRYGQELTQSRLAWGSCACNNERGAIAMARSADPNSASAQVLIMRASKTPVESMAAMRCSGRVVKGPGVVDKIPPGRNSVVQGHRAWEAADWSEGKPERAEPQGGTRCCWTR